MRVFLAVEPEKWVKEKVAEVQEMFRSEGIKLVEKENLHITLAFLGEKERKEIDEIISKLSFLEKFDAPHVRLSGLGTFGNPPRVIYINVLSKSLEEVAEAIWLKLGLDGKPTLHLTIGRVKHNKADLEPLKDLENIFIGDFVASEIKLKKSVLFPSGPVYSDLWSWKLLG